MTEKRRKLRKVAVAGAKSQECSYLDDLTTAGTLRTGHTNIHDWFGLHAGGTHNPKGVSGLQIDGYFREHSTTTEATEYLDPAGYYYDPGNPYGREQYGHDSQFVLRLPTDWNGKLVVTGPPGVRGQYANDFIISDFVLSK